MRLTRWQFSTPPQFLTFRLSSHREFVVALLFTLLLIVWESALFDINYFDYIRRTTTLGYEIWNSHYSSMLVISMLCSLLITFFFIWVSLRLRKLARICCFILFAFAVLYQYSYYNALYRFATAEDIMMASLFTDTTLFKDAIMMYIDWRALIPITSYGLILWKYQPKYPISLTSIILVLCIAILFFSLIFRVWYLAQSEFPTTSLSGFIRATTFLPWKVMNFYSQPREPIAYHARSRPVNNIIFVVDESIRADHLSINGYKRQTTPYLDQLMQQGLLYNWHDGVSSATGSLPSNNLLMTGITALPDREGRLQRQPSIFQYAKAMGYTTYYLDASNTTYWNGTPNDLHFIDHWENAETFADGAFYDSDTRLAEYTRKLLEHSTGNFIWINKRGVHFLYNNTFPQNQAQWSPIMSGVDYGSAVHAELVNSYDNGLHYNINTFFSTLLVDQSLLDHTTIVYTSDHGQTLADHGETWSHGKDTRSEALVPIFVIMNSGFNVDTGYKASHANLFATLLDLMAFPESERRYDYALSLLRAQTSDSQPRYYYFGSLDGSAPGMFVPFD